MKYLGLIGMVLLHLNGLLCAVTEPKAKTHISVNKMVKPTQSKKIVTTTDKTTLDKKTLTKKIVVTKTPLQLNIKNNSKRDAHLTGFTVTYAEQTTGSPMTISAKIDMYLESNHTKSIGFKIKIPNTGTPKFSPFVSEIEINGKSISTGYKAEPYTVNEQAYTLALLQITNKNGIWVRDVKAMKKADSAIPTPSVVSDQSQSKITPFKEAVVAAAIKKNKNSQAKFKKSAKKTKKIKKSKSSQVVDHVLVH